MLGLILTTTLLLKFAVALVEHAMRVAVSVTGAYENAINMALVFRICTT